MAIMIPVRSILAAVDFSDPSRVALDFAARLASQSRAALHVLYVLDPLLSAAADARGIDLSRESREELERFTATIAAARGCPMHHHVIAGRGTATICDIAVRERADLIVMGMRGMSGASRALFGSTTEGVLRHSDVPVFAIPESWAAPHPDARDLSGMGPVVAAIECSEPATAAAAAACQLAKSLGTSVSAVHVVPELNVLDRWGGHAQAAIDAAMVRARRELEPVLAGLNAGVEIPLRVDSGSVPERLALAVAPRAGEHPILVLGRHIRGSRRGAPGATTYRVLGMTRAPVLMHCLPEDQA